MVLLRQEKFSYSCFQVQVDEATQQFSELVKASLKELFFLDDLWGFFCEQILYSLSHGNKSQVYYFISLIFQILALHFNLCTFVCLG